MTIAEIAIQKGVLGRLACLLLDLVQYETVMILCQVGEFSLI